MPNYDALTQGLARTIVKNDQATPVYNFFTTNAFGGASIGTNQDFIQFDYRTIGVAIPSEAERGLDPNRVNYGSTFNEKNLFGVYMFDEDTVNLAQAKNRLFEEPLDGPWSVEQRELTLLAHKRDQMMRSFVAKTEALCAEAILTGSYTSAKFGTQSFPITSSMLSVSGANFTSNPYSVISNAALTIAQKGGMPTKLILNPTDAISLQASTAWQKMLDNRRVMGNAQGERVASNGLAYMGTVSGLACGPIDIYSYFGNYNGTAYLPQGKAILMPDTIGFVGYTGLLDGDGEVQNVVAQKERFKVYGEDRGDLKNTFIQGQTAPAPIITAIDRYCVITNLA